MTTISEAEPEVEAEVQSEETQEPVAESPPVIPPEPPIDCPDHVRQHYDQIREKEREVYWLEGEYLAAKEKASDAKKEFEAADKALRRLIARGADPQKELPFGKTAFGESPMPRQPKRIKLLKEVGCGPLPGAMTIPVGTEFDTLLVDENGDVSIKDCDGTVIELEPEEFEVIEWLDPAPAAVENDAWRSAPFAELGLTAKQNELFEAIGVKTIGDLEDLRAQIADNRMRGNASAQWPKGVGPAKVTDIENRVIDWLDKNRDKFGEVAVEAPAPEATEASDEELQVTNSEPVADDPPPVTHAKSNGKPKAKAKAGKRSGLAEKEQQQ